MPEDLADTAVEQLGGIDVLVNNAAYQMAQMGGIADITTEQFDQVMKTNLYAMFWLCKKAIPHMEAGATIINTSSVQAVNPSPELLVRHHQSRHPQPPKPSRRSWRRRASGECSRAGPDLDSADPGHHAEPEGAEPWREHTTQDAGQPAEVAPAYVFFASQESSYITAEMLAVTGGQPVT